MLNAEAIKQFSGDPRQEVAAGVAARHDEVTGERGFCRAHRPDVQIMHLLNACSLDV